MANEFLRLKDADETLTFENDFSDDLTTGETIASSIWVVPTPPTEGGNTKTSRKTTITISGGTARENYVITNRVTTSKGNIIEKTFTLLVTGDGSILIVETGVGLATAETYTTIAEADTFIQSHSNRKSWFNKTEAEKVNILIQATKLLDRRFRFFGVEFNNPVQALAWPRTKNYSRRGEEIAGGVIPPELKEATALVALSLSIDPDIDDPITDTAKVKSWSTDGLSLTFEGSKKGDETEGALLQRLADVELLLTSLGVRREAEADVRKTLVQ